MVNKRSIKFVKRNFSNMYEITHTPQYYKFSINFMTNLYKKKLCSYYKPLIWDSKKLYLHGEQWLANLGAFNCTKRFIFLTLSINGNHANALLVDNQTRHVKRIEPHGGVINSNSFLDTILTEIFNRQGYTYNNLHIECPYLGIQAASGETFGLCQTATIYLLGTYIDEETFLYKYYYDNRLAKEFLLDFASFLLANMRKKLSIQQRKFFDNYNTQDDEIKQDIMSIFGDSNFILDL